MRSITVALFVAVFLLVSYLDGGSEVEAYLDPGTGSMALQLLMGGIVAALATIRLYWRRLRSVAFRRRQQQQ